MSNFIRDCIARLRNSLKNRTVKKVLLALSFVTVSMLTIIKMNIINIERFVIWGPTYNLEPSSSFGGNRSKIHIETGSTSVQTSTRAIKDSSVFNDARYYSFEVNWKNAVMLMNNKEYDKAIESYKAIIQLGKTLFEKDSNIIANLYREIGVAYANKGNNKLSLEYLSKSVEYKDLAFRDYPMEVAQVYRDIGVVYSNDNNLEKAQEYLEKSLLVLEGIPKSNKNKIKELYSLIGEVYAQIATEYQNRQNEEKAIEFYQKAILYYKENYEENESIIGILYKVLGILCLNKKEYDRAIEYCSSSLEIEQNKSDAKPENISILFNSLGLSYLEKSNYIKAKECLFKALEISEKYSLPNIAVVYNNIGLIYGRNEDYDKAIEYYQKAIKLGFNNNEQQIFHYNLGDAYILKSKKINNQK